jgi:hypothetical protein
VGLEVLDRAARRLQELFGEEVLPLEDHISRAARKYLPDFIEHAGALPDRLRLLGLPGESRAQELLAELTDLLKGDAGDAPSRLGVPDSHIPEDVRWARAATAALDADGERDVRQARGLLNSLAEIGTLFPDQLTALATPDQIEALQDILDSERFHEQLPDLRGAMRAIREGVRVTYTDEWRQYRDALHAALTSLEARADWVLLSDADQAEIAARLALTLPETPGDENLLSAYRTLLVRFRSLPALQTDLEAEVTRRRPVEQPPDEEPGLEGPLVEAIPVQQIIPSHTISSEQELEAWLDSLRTLIAERLADGKQVRFSP